MLNPVTYFSKHSIQPYATLQVALANASKPSCFKVVADAEFCWAFYRTNVEPIDQVKNNLS